MCVNGINGYSEIHNSEKYFKSKNKRKTTEGIFEWIWPKKKGVDRTWLMMETYGIIY